MYENNPLKLKSATSIISKDMDSMKVAITCYTMLSAPLSATLSVSSAHPIELASKAEHCQIKQRILKLPSTVTDFSLRGLFL